MTSSPTREEVERVSETLLGWLTGPDSGQNDGIMEAGQLLRALLARAEAAERERDDWKRRAEDMHRRVTAAEGTAYSRWMRDQRDAARAEAARLTAEVASLRMTLGGKTFSASVPEPVGCPMPGACATVAEIVRGREVQAAWLRVIQAENTCGVTGKPCDAVRCGCAAEQEMLIREADETSAALAKEDKSND